MDARERTRVGAAVRDGIVPVVDRTRDGIRDLRGGRRADADVAKTGDLGLLGAHAAEHIEPAKLRLALHVAGGDFFLRVAGRAERIAGAEVEVLGPERGIGGVLVRGVRFHVGQPPRGRAGERKHIGERSRHRGRGGEVVPLPAATDFGDFLVAVEHAALQRRRDLERQAIAGVGAQIEDFDVAVVIAGQERD